MFSGIRQKITNRIFYKQIANEINRQASIKSYAEIEAIKSQLGYGYHPSSGMGSLGSGLGSGEKFFHGLGQARGPLINHFGSRLNARTAYHENVQARAFVERMSDTVADAGLLLESTPSHTMLGISEEAAQKWAHEVEERFLLWASSQRQEVTETMNFFQAQRFYQVLTHRDGEVFCRLYYHSRKGLLSKLRYGFLDPSQIRGDEITTGFGSLMGFESGIERGEFGEEKAYKIWTRNHKTKEFKSVTIPRFGLRSGRTFMLHGFVPDYPGQGRGISRLAHAIQDFANLTDFSCAQIMKAINQSSIMMYVKPSKDAPAANPLEGLMTRRGAGPARQTDFESVEGAENSTTTPNSGRPVNFQELPEATFTDPGSVGIFSAQAGEDVLPFKETAPSPNFDDFMLSFTSYLSASMSMPIEVVLMKFGENYSASRAALLLFWRVAVRWRKEMESDFLNPIYEMWLSEEIAMGRVVAPGWSDPVLRMAWMKNNWIGAPMPNIDPKRTADADRVYVELGAQDLDRVARNLNGSNGSSNRQRLKKQLNEMPDTQKIKK